MSASAYLFDANVWVALVFASHPQHGLALEAYRSASRARPAVFCRATELSFLRLTSTPALLRLSNATGLTNQDAIATLTKLLGETRVTHREEPEGIGPLWHRLGARDSASPKRWMDAYLAAFAIAGNLRLVTGDHDFVDFESEGLKLSLLRSGHVKSSQ